MKFANPFKREGIWLKGNIHTHTTASDGSLSPAEIAKTYAKWGYDFLFLTDHWKRTEVAKRNDILTIAAEETHFKVGENCHHVVCFDLDEEIKPKTFRSLNELAKFLATRGASGVIAHPYWSSTRSAAYLKTTGFVGLEIYNTVCEMKGRASSTVHWDDLLSAGKRLYGFAVDDTHRLIPGLTPGGWIMVKAKRKTKSAIFDAIRKGLFYSTRGPEIHDVNIARNKISVECSPCARINFIAKGNGVGKSVFSEADDMLTTASYEFPPHAVYVRMECVDANGKTAWSNPVFL